MKRTNGKIVQKSFVIKNSRKTRKFMNLDLNVSMDTGFKESFDKFKQDIQANMQMIRNNSPSSRVDTERYSSAAK